MLSVFQHDFKTQKYHMSNPPGKGAASTGHRLTTQAALEIINAGGNAFDGAIAAAFMACVCEPVLASPAGGGFAMIHDAKGTRLLDFFVQTPMAKNTSSPDFIEIEADFGNAKQLFHIGHASAATPGFMPGLFALHEKSASLPMATLIAPARKAAMQGVEITPFQNYLANVVSPILLHSQQSRAVFAPNGNLHQSGEIFRNPALADFLNQVGKVGASAFPVESILSDQKNSGHLRTDDFENYQVVERDSQCVEITGSNVHLNPMPAAGGILIALTFANLNKNTTQDIAEALKQVDIARRKSDNNLAALLKELGPPAHRGTTHISVVDDQQNACSMTLSNGEGNGYIVDDCGFMLNNMLGEADINPGGKLGWPQNTRMSSMMCPTIVEHTDGSIMALGSGGSNRIRSTIFQVLVNLLLRENSIAESITSPRLHIENAHLDFEDPDNPKLASQLKAAFPDHRLWPDKSMFFGGCHIVVAQSGQAFEGLGDHRRHGFFATT